MFLAGLGVKHRLVDVHRRAGILLHRLGHEGGVHAVLIAASRMVRLNRNTCWASSIGSTVAQVDLSCAGPSSWDQRVDLQALLVGEVVDIVDQLVELVDYGRRIGLAAGDLRPEGPWAAAAGSPDRRLATR